MAKSNYINVPKNVQQAVMAGNSTLDQKVAILNSLDEALGTAKAAARTNVTTANAAVAAGVNPTKAEYDAAVALLNDLKTAFNDLLTKLRTANLLSN